MEKIARKKCDDQQKEKVGQTIKREAWTGNPTVWKEDCKCPFCLSACPVCGSTDIHVSFTNVHGAFSYTNDLMDEISISQDDWFDNENLAEDEFYHFEELTLECFECNAWLNIYDGDSSDQQQHLKDLLTSLSWVDNDTSIIVWTGEGEEWIRFMNWIQQKHWWGVDNRTYEPRYRTVAICVENNIPNVNPGVIEKPTLQNVAEGRW